MYDEKEEQGEEMPEEPNYAFNLKLVKLTARINTLEDGFEDVNHKIDKLTIANTIETPKVNKPEIVRHPEFINKEGVNGDNDKELTEKQAHALALIKDGLTNSEIAKEMGVSRIMAFKYRKKLTELGLIEEH